MLLLVVSNNQNSCHILQTYLNWSTEKIKDNGVLQDCKF